jgi:hypothetical protein
LKETLRQTKVLLRDSEAVIDQLTDLDGKVVAFRRQNRVRQLEDTWPIGFLCLYMSVRSIGR